MKKIKFIILVLSFCYISKSNAQETIKESRGFKFFTSSYDKDDFVLKRVNDTLNVYISEEKKLMYLWTNIGEDENFPEFEKDIDLFFELVNQIGLDFEANNFNIRFSPETGQLTYEKGVSTKYKKIGDTAIPIHRHTVRFTNRKGLTDIEIYLGEIDELQVLKEAGITDIVRNMLLDNGWFARYNNRLFNKDLKIGANGDKEIVTYHNLEGIEKVEFNFDIGTQFLNSHFPFTTEFSAFLDLGKKQKWRNNSKSGVVLSWLHYAFVQKNEDSGFDFNNDMFITAGWKSGVLTHSATVKYGRMISSNHASTFFGERNNLVGFDFQVSPHFKVSYNNHFKDFKTDWISTIGVSYRFF